MDYNFDLVFMQAGTDEATRTYFKPVVTISFNKDVLRNFVRGLLSGFDTKLRGNLFRKSTDELRPEVFIDGRLVVSEKGKINVIRIASGYKIENNRIRFTMIKIYELKDWSEITTIRTEKKYDKPKCVYVLMMKPDSVAEDYYSPDDKITIESMMDTLDRVVIGASTTYAAHIQKVQSELQIEKKLTLKELTAEVASVSTASETTGEVASDDFPF